MIAFAGFHSDTRVAGPVLFVGADHVLIYVYTFFHVVCSLSFVLIVAASLRIIPASVNGFYLLSLFPQPARRTAQAVILFGHGWLAALITNIPTG